MQDTSSGSLLSGFKEASKVCIETLLAFEQQHLNPWLRSCDNMLCCWNIRVPSVDMYFHWILVHGLWIIHVATFGRIVVGRPKLHLQRLVVAAAASKSRRANLCVRKQETVPLPTLADPLGNPQHLSSFLQQPAGTKSMLNTNALERFEYLGDGVFRCYLPKLLLLKLEVAPIVDLFVSATHNDCCVEMLSCKVGS